MNRATTQSRADDTTSLGKAGLAYLADTLPNGVITPPISLTSTKGESRGFKHPVTARLLCPIKYLTEFDADPTA